MYIHQSKIDRKVFDVMKSITEIHMFRFRCMILDLLCWNVLFLKRNFAFLLNSLLKEKTFISYKKTIYVL